MALAEWASSPLPPPQLQDRLALARGVKARTQQKVSALWTASLTQPGWQHGGYMGPVEQGLGRWPSCSG